MNLTQLRYFIAVARGRSISRAAKELRISQPAITRQVKLLEAEFETALIARHHRGIRLTDAGKMLLERAEFQIQAFDQMQSEFRSLSFAPSGAFRLGCTPGLTRPLISPLVRNFLRSHPNVKVELRESISDELIRAVLTDGLDLAVASTITPQPHLERELLFEERIWLFGRPDVVLPRSVSLKYLASLPLLLARRGNATRDLLEARCAQARLQLNLVVETDSTQLNDELVRDGVGYVVAPYFALRDRVSSGTLRGAPIESLTIQRSLVRRRDRPITGAMREFLRILHPEIDKMAKQFSKAEAVVNAKTRQRPGRTAAKPQRI